MAHSKTVAAVVAAVAVLGWACGSPTDPCFFIDPPPGTYQSRLDPTRGQGVGGVSATSFTTPEATFAVSLRFRVKCTAPNATLVVQRAADSFFGASDPPRVADRICQRAQAEQFVSFPRQPGTEPVTFTTDGNGEGSIEFEFRSPGLVRGQDFDVAMRLVDNPTAPTLDLRSGCMTIHVN